jgi:hypothetical protein
MGRGSQNLLYQPINTVLKETEKGSSEWQAEIEWLNDKSIDRLQWLAETVSLAEQSQKDKSLLKPLLNLLTENIADYINYGYLKRVEQDLTPEVNQLVSLLYNNRRLVEDRDSLKSLFLKLFTNCLTFSPSFRERPFYNNLRAVQSRLIVPEGRLYITPRNRRGKGCHFVEQYSQVRICDNKPYTQRNWAILNEADDNPNHQRQFCKKCLKKISDNKHPAQAAYKKQSFATFRNNFSKQIIEKMFFSNRNNIDNYTEFQDQFASDLLAASISQAAEEQLGWSKKRQQDFYKQFQVINNQKLIEEQSTIIPKVRVNDLTDWA